MKITLQTIIAWLPTVFVAPLSPMREATFSRLVAMLHWAFGPFDDEDDATLNELRATLKDEREKLAAAVAAESD